MLAWLKRLLLRLVYGAEPHKIIITSKGVTTEGYTKRQQPQIKKEIARGLSPAPATPHVKYRGPDKAVQKAIIRHERHDDEKQRAAQRLRAEEDRQARQKRADEDRRRRESDDLATGIGIGIGMNFPASPTNPMRHTAGWADAIVPGGGSSGGAGASGSYDAPAVAPAAVCSTPSVSVDSSSSYDSGSSYSSYDSGSSSYGGGCD